MIGIMMSQVRPNDHLNIRRDFQTLVYQALVNPSRMPGRRSSGRISGLTACSRRRRSGQAAAELKR